MAQALKKREARAQLQSLDFEHVTRSNWREIQNLALYHYDMSLSSAVRSEDTATHRAKAKEYANALLVYQPAKVNALNLLARIALDEGFYQLSETFLEDAIKIKPNDAGCWYSLGHVNLDQKRYTQALNCFSKALSISPTETRSATSLAYTLAQQGRVVEAFNAYRKLFKLHPRDPHVRAKLFEVVRHIKADYYQEELARDTIRWLKIESANYQALTSLVISLLQHKYDLDNDAAVVDLQELAVDELFLLSMGKIYFTDKTFEAFVKTVRKEVLLNVIAANSQDKNLIHLAASIALHTTHNEHIYDYDDDEKNLIVAIKHIINESPKADTDINELGHLLVLYGMYEPIQALPEVGVLLSSQALTGFPDYCREFFEKSVLEPQEEKRIAASIKQITAIHSATSNEVKHQYEENPYPRWLHLGYNTPTNYGRALERELIGFRAPTFFNLGPLKILIAGAGTGQHALRVANYFRNTEVIAIDLSARALAYGKRMADKYQIPNIKFMQADILELENLNERFHVIECSGVLHHMTEPQKALGKLTNLLVHRGMIKIGLYSFRAREIVRTLRDIIHQYELSPSADGIRTLRQAIFTGRMPYDFSGILSSSDFYSMSGCRDLLFHVQEAQYGPLEIQSLLNTANLTFQGFIVPDSVRKHYQHQFKDDQRCLNLYHWNDFEEQNPKTFAGMFQLYAQKL